MNAAEMRARNARSGFELFTGQIPFRRDRHTAKDLLVKVGQGSPIAGDEIGVNVLCLDAHLT